MVLHVSSVSGVFIIKFRIMSVEERLHYMWCL